MDINPTLLAVCGVTCSCGGVLLLAAMVLSRVFGGSILLPIVAVGGSVFRTLFNRGENPEEKIDEFLHRRKQKREQPDASFTAQSANLDFESQVQQRLNQQYEGRFDAKKGRRAKRSSQSNLGKRYSGGSGDWSGFDDDSSSDSTTDVPSLRQRRRRGGSRRGRDSNARDDEIFGGILDEDGDGYAG